MRNPFPTKQVPVRMGRAFSDIAERRPMRVGRIPQEGYESRRDVICVTGASTPFGVVLGVLDTLNTKGSVEVMLLDVRFKIQFA